MFTQNGMLLPLLEQHGLADNTAALLYLSAAADGSYTDGRQTVVCGRCGGGAEAAGSPLAVFRPVTCGMLRASVGRRKAMSLFLLTRFACTPLALRRWAGAVAALLHRGGVQCRVVERGEYLALMIEKLLCEFLPQCICFWSSAQHTKESVGR